MTAAIIAIAAAVLCVAADYIIKYIVASNMQIGQSIPAIKGLLNWTYITNKGASWGIMQGKTIFLVAVTVILMAAMIFLLFRGRLRHPVGYASFALIIGGGIGNLIDRLFNGGAVVDYIDISPLFNFPIFNFADCCVTVGGVLLCIYILFLDDRKETAEQ